MIANWAQRDASERMGARTVLLSLGMGAMGVMGTYEEPLTLSIDSKLEKSEAICLSRRDQVFGEPITYKV